MTSQPITPQSGIVVSTAITAGEAGLATNHAEGIVVSTAIVAGEAGLATNHAEGLAAV